MNRPEPTEYNPYFQHYINLAGEGDFETLFEKNTKDTIDYFSSIPEDKHNHKYAPGKWTIKEVLMHCIDTERVRQVYCFLFAYRNVSDCFL